MSRRHTPIGIVVIMQSDAMELRPLKSRLTQTSLSCQDGIDRGRFVTFKVIHTRILFVVKGDVMAITTTSLLPAPVQQSFSYKLLAVPTPEFIHKIPAVKKNMPRNGGTTMRFRRYNPLATAKVPLGNSGVTPPAQTLSAVDIDAKMSFYGTYVVLNEQVTLGFC